MTMTQPIRNEPVPADDLAVYDLYIDGRWEPSADGATSERRSPATGRLVGRYASGAAADVDRAVTAARRAFDDTAWPVMPARQRSAILLRTAALLRERAEGLGRRIALELGKPIRFATTEVLLTAEVFEYYGCLIQGQRGDAVSQHTPDALGLVLQEPVGVVAAITPWNFPLLLLSWKVAPALAAGCTVVAKPATQTPGSTLDLATVLHDAGLPDGVYNVVTGGGIEVGSVLTRHPGVDKIAFTGSTEVGRDVLVAAATNIKKVTLELGGKSANIIFGDADLDEAVRGAYWGAFLNTGQACQAGSRLLVQRDIHDDVMARLATLVEGSRVGDPLDKRSLIGPVVDERQLATVMRYIETGTGEGATLAAGGHRMTDGPLADGFYLEPTLFDDVSSSMAVGREEIFGPVLSVFSFDDAADAVRQANDSPYGLAAAVWTSNVDTAITTAKRLRAGTVWVNAYHDAGLPFVLPMGGYKASGIGRELGREGLESYFETKSVHIHLAQN